MKVCVCGGTNPATNPRWLGFATELGNMLVAGNYDMVWGGNAFGVLSHIHKEYAENEKANTLVLPSAYRDDLKKMKTDKVIETQLVVERTHKMFTMADVVVVIPGGIGTVYEFWTAVEGKRAGEYNIDIILLNFDNFYKYQLEHFDFINKNGFTKVGKGGAPYKMQPTDLFTVVTTPQQVINLLDKLRKKSTK